jgi:hypothetical protein
MQNNSKNGYNSLLYSAQKERLSYKRKEKCKKVAEGAAFIIENW